MSVSNKYNRGKGKGQIKGWGGGEGTSPWFERTWGKSLLSDGSFAQRDCLAFLRGGVP